MSLVTYLVAAGVAWVGGPDTREPVVRATAEAVVEVTRTEPPLFHGDEALVRTSLVLMATAANESGFHQYVDEGVCNERGFIADGRGHCDHGRAWTVWQIQTGRGITLTELGWRVGGDIHGRDLLVDRVLAARTALHMLRQSWIAAGSFCWYTGEPCASPHPLADNHLSRALSWWRTHPAVDG